jgi:hypothetical protein
MPAAKSVVFAAYRGSLLRPGSLQGFPRAIREFHRLSQRHVTGNVPVLAGPRAAPPLVHGK